MFEDLIPQQPPRAAFDPNGGDYDYETARAAGLAPDATGHWPSRDPRTGMILKGRGHETFTLTEQGEAQAGNTIVFRDGRYFSNPATSQPAPSMFEDLVPSGPVVTPGGGFNGATRIEPARPPQKRLTLFPESVGGAARGLAVGTQGVVKGLGDMVLAPFDLAAGAQNLITGGVNKVFGTDIPQARPASQLAGDAIDAAGVPYIKREDMAQSERLMENVNRFGTQGVTMGSMLAARAPAAAEAVLPAETFGGRVMETMQRPYRHQSGRPVVGDAVAGAGAGAGVTAAQEYLPQEPTTSAGRVAKTVADFAAPLVGAIGASGVQGLVEGLGGMLRNIANRRTDVNVPVNAQTGAPYRMADTERAAGDLQSRVAGSPQAVAQDIRANASELTDPRLPGETPVDASAVPTTGLLSRDTGLVAAEEQARLRNRNDFVERDQNVKGAAAQRVGSVQDPDANQGAVVTAAENARESRMAEVEQRLQQLEDITRRVAQARQEQGAELAPVANAEARANASRRLDTTIVDEGYVPARTEKNRQFDTAPGRNEELPADDIFRTIDRIRGQANDLAPGTLPEDFIRRLDALRPVIDEETGLNVGGPGTAMGGDLADLRKFIGAAEQRAQQSGNFDLADNLRSLRSQVNRTIEEAPGYADANANYRQFADRYRPERNDEAAKFTRELDRSGNDATGNPNRGSTPPSETAGRFLSGPEKAQSLNRMLTGAANEQAGQAAVRDSLRGDFANSALNADGTINPARAAAWARNNADVLEQFPAVRDEINGVVQQAQRGERLGQDATAFLDQARRTRNATESEVDRSVIGTLLREDPRDVASKILGGGYGAEKRLDEIATLVRSDPDAARGWKAAVSEVLVDRVTSAKKIGETPEVQAARLAKEFQNNEAILAKVYSPEEMNTLRQAHKLLGYFKEAEKRALAGSQTAERQGIPQWVQLAARHLYGDLKGGGIIRRFKLMLELLPTNKQQADEIVQAAWFNPDVAAYLLEKPVKNPNVPMLNVNLRRLIAGDNAARESGPDEK
jgi:hypothetical protein